MAAGLRLPPHVQPRHLALAGAGAVGLGLLAVVDPNRHQVGPPCPLRLLTGLDCPLCGATRATYALVHGDVLTAFDHNALYVLSLPLVGLLMLLWLVRGRSPRWLGDGRVRWGLVAVAAAFAVARNLPIEALSVLGSAADWQ